jgi:uncharacterized protein
MPNMNESRRNFIKTGMAGILGGTMLPGLMNENGLNSRKVTKKQLSAPGDNKEIVYRTLGRTGIKVPVISFGCGYITDPALVTAALDSGIIHMDTAYSYANGKSEESIAEAIKGRKRDSFILGTKAYMEADNRTGLFSEKTKVKTFIERLDSSFKKLGVDYVDILYLHDVVKKEAALFDPLVEVLEKYKKAGKTRAIGVSFHRNEAEILKAIADDKRYDVVMVSYNFRQPHREEVKEAIAYAAKAGVGIVVMKAMAGVYWDQVRTKPINAKAALKWVLQDENIHTIVSGFMNYEQLEENKQVMAEIPLTPEEKNDLHFGYIDKEPGLYCAQCDKCRSQCKNNLDIPAYMRSYMYAYAYKKPAEAKRTIELRGSENIPCSDCRECKINCTMGFNIREKMLDISRLKNIPDEFLA